MASSSTHSSRTAVSKRTFWSYVLLGACFAFTVNIAYQIWRKPTELVGLFDSRFHKTPTETWRAYGDAFEAKSTSTLTPELLAALAQAETNGNPIARTYWKWSWTSNLARIYAPASSSVGLYQITDGTFEEARRFCVIERRAQRADEDGGCWFNALYSRLIPSHAIEMTAARLHWQAERIVREAKLLVTSLRERQRLAAVIHLCGVQKGERFARFRFNLKSLGRCGDHDPSAYMRRVERLVARFRALRSDAHISARELASADSTSASGR